MATSSPTTPDKARPANLPGWALEAIQLYESNAPSQFVIFGNVNDEIVIPSPSPHLGSLTEFLQQVLLPRFDVVLSYDIGNAILVEKGVEIFSRWPQMQHNPDLPKAPRPPVETLRRSF